MRVLAGRNPIPFRNNNFDLIRLLAALQVVLFHSIDRLKLHPEPWTKPLSFFSGVPIFFVASGFMVSASYERQQRDKQRYFRNRALRILPGLWVCLFATVLVTYYFGFRPHRLGDYMWFPAQMMGAIYTPHFLRSFGTGTYNGALWTIPLELQFYVVLPVVYLVAFRKRSNAALLSLLGCFIALSLALSYLAPPVVGPAEPHFNKLVRYSFLPQFYLFLYGVVLQRCRAFELNIIAGKGPYWAFILVMFCLFKPDWSTADMIALMLLATTTISAAYTFPGLTILLREQDISYGVYITTGF